MRHKEFKYKEMPEEVARILSQTERIQAHFNDQYELSEEDAKYLDKVNTVFAIIHGESDNDMAREKIRVVFKMDGNKQISDLVNAARLIYGDFFEMNRDVMRIIQEKRHQRTYEAAMRNADYPAAERALKSIDQLYQLYQRGTDTSRANTALPQTRRTSNTGALKKLTDGDEEE